MTESRRVETHIRKLGLFGWLFRIVFWAFNVFMALWAWLTSVGLSRLHQAVGTSPAAKAGYDVGVAIDIGALAFLWLAGAVILGLFVLLTRGRKTVVIRAA
jgi:hypothetical protein